MPSRNALRALRQLALAGGAVGGICTFAAASYDMHRRIRIAEQIIENKRTIRTSAPNYDATAAARRLTRLAEAAEAAEFHRDSSTGKQSTVEGKQGEASRPPDEASRVTLTESSHPWRPQSHFNKPQHVVFTEPRLPRNIARVDEIARAYEAKQGEAMIAEGKKPLDELLARFMRQKEEIKAANLFLKHVVAKEGEEMTISFQRREIACDIFAMNCLKGNIFIARAMYERIEQVSRVDGNMWTAMIHLLARDGHIESAARVFNKYRWTFSLPTYMLEIVVRCLVETHRLSAAKGLVLTRMNHDKDGVIRGAYLDGIWKKTQNVDFLCNEFETFLRAMSRAGRTPTCKLSNPMLKAYVLSGRHEEAMTLLSRMSELGVKLDCRGMGLLALAKALEADWEGVLSVFRDMHNLGFKNQRSYVAAFDRVFLEYYPTHTGSQILDFLLAAITELEIRPDKILHEHIIMALVERGDEDAVSTFQGVAEERGWKALSEENLEEIIRERQLAMTDAPRSTWNMMQAAKKQTRFVATSRRIQGASVELYSGTPNSNDMALINQSARYEYPNTMNSLVSKAPIEIFVSLSKNMEVCIHAGRFGDATEKFWEAVDRGFVIKPVQMQLAVIATLLHKGNRGLEDVRHLINTQWTAWTNLPKLRTRPQNPIVMPLMFQKIMQLDPKYATDSLLIKTAIFEFFELCSSSARFRAKNHAAMTVCRRLIETQRSGLAVNILTTIYLSKWRKIYGFDQVPLKMFMRAFAYSNNPRGVWWCMVTTLCRKEPPAPFFIAEIKKLMPVMEESFDAASLRAVDHVYHALQQKLEGNPKWAKTHRTPEEKRKTRAQMVSPYSGLVTMSWPIEEIVRVFDEEMEFDRVLDRPRWGTEVLNYWWDEERVTAVGGKQPEHPMYPSKWVRSKQTSE